ncbi:MAG: hypothetical protein K0A89_00020 [ANME-2 cluster archaeon]|nr:hypothetical protein [ANME-2 cluster archaeon]
MKNKQGGNVKYIPAKNVKRSENSIIHRWMSMLKAGVCTAAAGAAALWVDGSAVQQKAITNRMCLLNKITDEV